MNPKVNLDGVELGKRYAEDLVTGASQVLKPDNIPNAAPARCTRMPEGWKCIRPAIHKDGCFAYPVEHESDQVSHASDFELGLISGVVQAQNVVQSVVETVLKRVLEKSQDESETDEDAEGVG